MIKKILKKKVYQIFNNILDLDAKNIDRALQRKALESTVNFILTEKRLLKSTTFANKLELLKHAINEITVDGLIMEFGVYKGETINYIASLLPNKQIYGFDSFEGLPETWRYNFYKGKFKVDNLPKVKDNVTLIKGWFEDTLPDFIEKNNYDVSFIHIDCDLYSSTKTIFYYLKNNIVPGTVIVFDEFFNYPGWEDGEFKAFYEFVEECEVAFEWLGFVINHEQVALKVTRIKKDKNV
jgi:predicted O-methyltransferase YrrM